MPKLIVVVAIAGVVACSPNSEAPSSPSAPKTPVYVVLFTHIEDNTPAGLPGSAAQRASYLALRARLIEMGALARRHDVRWSLQPDWSVLLAALQNEDFSVRASTSGLNVLRYLRDSLSVAIDPHSHEGSGYNYTDVAHLLDSLGVGGSTVVGGHIWDPALPQFQQWDRFRVPVAGRRFPSALWRGDILMGSGTPNHTNDPTVSGIWRPRNRNAYWEDDPNGNITCVGAYKGNLAGITELVSRYRTRAASSTCMLTASIGIRPVDLLAPNGITIIENSIIRPVASMRDAGDVRLTDFTALVADWRRIFGARACIHLVPDL